MATDALTPEESELLTATMIQLAEDGKHDELDALADMTPDELKKLVADAQQSGGAAQMADTFPDADNAE